MLISFTGRGHIYRRRFIFHCRLLCWSSVTLLFSPRSIIGLPILLPSKYPSATDRVLFQYLPCFLPSLAYDLHGITLDICRSNAHGNMRSAEEYLAHNLAFHIDYLGLHISTNRVLA
jgi:hypothetical protein